MNHAVKKTSASKTSLSIAEDATHKTNAGLSWQPFFLTIAEIADPQSVIEKFFGAGGLQGSREFLKEWFLRSLSPADDEAATLDLIYNYHRMQKFMEASWMVLMQGRIKNDEL